MIGAKTPKAQLREMLIRMIDAFDEVSDIHGPEFDQYRKTVLDEAKELLKKT